MSQIMLSVCIPTYNFGRFIGETLRSITPQLTEEVEIVVLDGGSTDDTADVVEGFRERCPSISYVRHPVRGGIDRDMAQVVELARGTYCWLFSADDLMRSGAIAKVLRWIQSGSDLYLCRHSNCTVDMKFVADHPVLRLNSEATFDLGDSAARARYFLLAESTEAFFSFMGTLIVRRRAWQSAPLNEAFIGSCWAHAARFFQLMARGLVVTYSPEVLLDRRGDNDSFADRGMVNRQRIAIAGYHRIADTFLGAGDLAFHVRRTLRNEYGFRQFALARIQCRRSPQSEDLGVLVSLIRQAYVDTPVRGWILRLLTAITPTSLYFGMRDLYRYARPFIRRLVPAK